jgi:hypothetical protein
MSRSAVPLTGIHPATVGKDWSLRWSLMDLSVSTK